MRFLTAMTLGALALFVLQAAANPSGEPSRSAMKFNPQLSPKYVDLLKQQADLRKAFYGEQAKAKAELKESQVREEKDLRSSHREARAKFLAEPHPRDERKAFFRAQREEMATLKARQKSDFKNLDGELKRKLTDFHAQQVEDQKAMREKLVEAHRTTSSSR